MARKKSTTRATRKTRRLKMAEIAKSAFNTALTQALEYSALVNPNGTLRTAIGEYLGAMRDRLEWTERREAEERAAVARKRERLSSAAKIAAFCAPSPRARAARS